MKNKDFLNFDIHSNVVFKLGEDLITDSYQALIELIKNCYDADATYAIVDISCRDNDISWSHFKETQGVISIEDDGSGMTLEEIKNGWLLISHSAKKHQKENGILTERKRIPLGDKGLGRLGVQRLGKNIEIVTRSKKNNEEYTVSFSWDDFHSKEKLSEVPVSFTKSNQLDSHGTKIIISGLKDLEFWGQPNSKSTLQHELAKMVSPFRSISNFTVVANINGERLDLIDISEAIRESAHIRYWLDFDGEEFKVRGTLKSNYLSLQTLEEKRKYSELLKGDGIKKFVAYLMKNKAASDYGLRHSKDAAWMLEVSRFISLNSLDKRILIDNKTANPGPFKGEIDSYNLRELDSSSFDKASELKDLIKFNAGIKVFRDGFGIRVKDDWLGLGGQQTSGSSWYGLRPGNTLGYIALSGEYNSCLKETTDREGFIQNEYYHNFYGLLQDFISFAHEFQEFVRRSWLTYREKETSQKAKISEEKTPIEITETLGGRISSLSNTLSELPQISNRLEQNQQKIQSVLEEAEDSLFADKTSIERTKKAIEQTIVEARNILSTVTQKIEVVTELQHTIELLEGKLLALNEQMSAIVSTVSLGITAEALTHELFQITSSILERTQRIKEFVANENIESDKLNSYFEFIKASLSGIKKQISYLDPSLRYMREQRDAVMLAKFIKGWKGHKNPSNATIHIRESKDFTLSINPGKLYQVLDNLYINSTYWLEEAMRTQKISSKDIFVEIQSPCIRFYDNGLGVDNAVTHSLFEPFVTRKKNKQGRGLGLYIVQQLLDAENAFISLLPQKNEFDRCYIFEITFIGGVK